MNTYFGLKGDEQFQKNDALIAELKEWVDKQYEDGRVTVITDEELVEQIITTCRELGINYPGEKNQ